MRLLQGLGHHADGLEDAVLDALAPLRRGLERPGRVAGRDLPELALEGEHLLGPALLDDLEAFLEGGAVGGVDLVVLVRQGALDAVRVLGHDVDPAALVAAREAGIGAPARHVVEHGDVLGHADRVRRRQHDAELAHADALGLHGDVEVEQDGVVGDLEALDVEMVLGEGDRIVAEVVGQPALLGHLAQHLLVEIGPHAGHARLDIGLAAERRQIEQRDLHRFPRSQFRIIAHRVTRSRRNGKRSGTAAGLKLQHPTQPRKLRARQEHKIGSCAQPARLGPLRTNSAATSAAATSRARAGSGRQCRRWQPRPPPRSPVACRPPCDS